jgi:hypothetical protein
MGAKLQLTKDNRWGKMRLERVCKFYRLFDARSYKLWQHALHDSRSIIPVATKSILSMMTAPATVSMLLREVAGYW